MHKTACVVGARGGIGSATLRRLERALKDTRPLKRMAAPDEIAATIAFLLSDDAGFITRAVVQVDGGVRMN